MQVASTPVVSPLRDGRCAEQHFLCYLLDDSTSCEGIHFTFVQIV